jgi:isopentenyldiphosphate isomerase
MELWDIYDKDRIKSNITKERGSKLDYNEYHLVVHICIFNSKGEMLIQQRQTFKQGWPNLWDITVGGCAKVGETSETAAERELFEELGYSADLTKERPLFTINFYDGFDDYYIIEREIDLDTLTLQQEEVQNVKWADKGTILKMIKDGTFIPYHNSIIELLFDNKMSRGSIKC